VSLFGATSPARSGPYGFEHLVVEGDAPCRPCYSRRCSIGRKCMEAITEDRVMAKIESALRERDATAATGADGTPECRR